MNLQGLLALPVHVEVLILKINLENSGKVEDISASPGFIKKGKKEIFIKDSNKKRHYVKCKMIAELTGIVTVSNKEISLG